MRRYDVRLLARDEWGACLDTTLLFAFALEAASLHPVILLFNGFAAVGVWLTRRTFGDTVETEQMEVREAGIPAFGKFAVKNRPEREGRDPTTVKPVTIAASKNVPFTAAKG